MVRLAPLLATLLLISLATPALARSAMDAYGDALDMMNGSRAVTTAADDKADTAAEMKAFMAYATRQLNLAKAELRQLDAAYRVAMREFKGDAHECERETLTGIYAAERSRLKSRIREYRQIRGDRRGFFTRAWHSIGPVGRRIARAIGDGAVDALASGGLGGGVARRILLSAGRDELKGAALRAVARGVQGRSAVAVAAASSGCGDEVDPGELEEGVPAIPPGTYVGEWPMDLAADEFVTSKVVEANAAELRVAEDGAVTGEMGYREVGVLDGCPGYVMEWTFVVDTDQRIGPELPQLLSVTYDALMVVPIGGTVSTKDSFDFVCGDDVEPFIDESGTEEVEISIDDDGALTLTVGDDIIELQWVP